MKEIAYLLFFISYYNIFNLILRPSDSDIDLLSLDEFYEKAPETISNPDVTKTDQHQQYLARLNYELQERKK